MNKDMIKLVILPVAVLVVIGAVFYTFVANTRNATAVMSRGDVEGIVRDYIEAHPDVIIASVEKMYAKQRDEQQEDSTKGVKENLDKLQDSKGIPTAGNPNGDVVIVEFFDYSCGYCKRAAADVSKLLAEDKNIKYIFRDFPILGADSLKAAYFAEAVYKASPSKFLDFHAALMAHNGPKTEDALMKLAGDLGISTTVVKQHLQDPSIHENIKKNLELGRSIGVRGTPAFIIGDVMIPGAIGLEDMKKQVADARAKGK